MPKSKEISLIKKNGKLDLAVLLSGISGLIKKVPKSKLELVGQLSGAFDYVLAANKGILKEKFMADISDLITEGTLDTKFLEDDLTRRTYTDIAQVIDQENPSNEKIDAMKALLLVVANKEEKDRYEVSTHLNTLKQLDSVELNVLVASYELRKSGRADQKRPKTKSSWRRYVLERLEWDENMIFQIEMREAHMVELRVLDGHPGHDPDSIPHTDNCRLTGLGIKLGDIIT